MITSDRQYLVALRKHEVLQAALTAPVKPGVPDQLARAARGQTASLLKELAHDIEEYEALLSAETTQLTLGLPGDLKPGST